MSDRDWGSWEIEDATKETIGSIATACTFVLFASPAKTFVRIINSGSTQEFRGEPFLFSFFNCALWVLYAIYQPGRLLPLICNVVGGIFSLVFVLLFAKYCPNPRAFLLRFCGIVAIAAIFGGAVKAPAFDTKIDGRDQAAFSVGLLANIFNILMYMSPLAVMKKVMDTRSVEYLPFLFSFFALLTSTFWYMYGVYACDIWITIPNCMGIMLASGQLTLYALYRNSGQHKPLKEEHEAILIRDSDI